MYQSQGQRTMGGAGGGGGGNYGGGGGYGGPSVGKGTVGSAVDERMMGMMATNRPSLMQAAVQSHMGAPAQPQPQAGAGSANAGGGPTAQEIVDYARYIGMDPISDVNLLWIAEEALCASLPEGWTVSPKSTRSLTSPIFDAQPEDSTVSCCVSRLIATPASLSPLQEHHDAAGNVFYYNTITGVSSWEHPLDEYYRSLFLKLKKILIDNRAAYKVNDAAVAIQSGIR